MIDKSKVMELLGKIEDPELHRPLTDLDMIKSVEINGDEVNIEVSLTTQKSDRQTLRKTTAKRGK
jgi:ATP-binding protein involved in chromosome partitioning